MAKDNKTPAAASATPAKDTKTPRERMQTVGVARVNAALDALRILENCSDRASYEYTEAEVNKIFSALKDKTASVEQAFRDALAGKSKKVVKTGFGL